MSKRNPSVLWTVEQGLNTDEKAQARSNIGVADAISGAINALDAEEVSTNGTNVQFQVTETDGKITGVSVTTDNTVNATDVSNAITTAINGLDSNATSTDGTNVQVKVTETDGKISAVNITSDNTVNATDIGNAITSAINGLDSTATSNDGTNVQVKVTETDGKISAVNITSDNTVNSTDVSNAITTAIGNLDVPATGTGAITGFGANKTLATLTEDNGKIAATFQNIALGNINHEGKIGTEANKVIVTGANGVLTTGETSDSTELQSSTTLATAQAAYTADKIVYITMENTADDIQAILDAGKYPVLVVTGNNGVAYIPFIRSTDIGWGSTNNRYQFKISCGGDLSHMPDRTSVQYICTANSTPQWSGPYTTSDEYVSNDPRIIVNNNSITLARDSALSTNNIYSSQYQGINAVTNYQKIATCTFTKSSQQNDWLYTVYQLELVVSEIGYCDGITQHKWNSDHSGRFSLAIAVEQIGTTLSPEIVHGQWIYYTNRSIPIKLKSLRVYKTTDGDNTTFELWLYQDHAQDLSFKVLQNNRYDSSIENLGDHRDPIHQQMNPWNITALTSGMRDTEPGGTLLGSWDPSTAPEYVPSYTNASPGDSLVVNASGTGLEWRAPVNADWNATSGPAQILNKPTIPSIQYKNYGGTTTDASTLLIDADDPDGYVDVSVDSTSKGRLVAGPYRTLLNSGINGVGDTNTPVYIKSDGTFDTCLTSSDVEFISFNYSDPNPQDNVYDAIVAARANNRLPVLYCGMGGGTAYWIFSGEGSIGYSFSRNTSASCSRATIGPDHAFSITEQLIAAGDVVGPSSATNNHIPLYDGTTGKLIKNSKFYFTDEAQADTAEAAKQVKTKAYNDPFRTSQQIVRASQGSEHQDGDFAYWYALNKYRSVAFGISSYGNIKMTEFVQSGSDSVSPSSEQDIITSTGTGDNTKYLFKGVADKASKIDTSYAIGANNQPVYVAVDGTVTACNFQVVIGALPTTTGTIAFL